jgi:hypothetical protein
MAHDGQQSQASLILGKDSHLGVSILSILSSCLGSGSQLGGQVSEEGAYLLRVFLGWERRGDFGLAPKR